MEAKEMATVTLDLSESQIADIVRRLPPESRRAVLRALIPDLDSLDGMVDYGSDRIRDMCAQRGIKWDSLTEDERQRVVDDLLHRR
jgi:hypothetical protein